MITNSKVTEKKVYVGFTLDFVHAGHLNVLNQATNLGSVILGILTDEAVCGHRSLPVLSLEERKNIGSNLKGVSEVVEQEDWSYVNNILKFKPDYFVHGNDWIQNDSRLREEVLEALESYGGKLIETEKAKLITSAKDRFFRSQQLNSVNRLSSLKRLIGCKKIVRLLEAHNPMSALIAEILKVRNPKTNGFEFFDGFWSSSLTDSTSMGLPDIEVLDFSRRIQNINSIFDVTSKPLVYDADTGGLSEHLVINSSSLQRIGVSAMIIEDKVGLKKNSLLGNDVLQTQDSIEGFSSKINQVTKAKIHDDFMVIARIESLILEAGINDAVKRAYAYVEAGADGIMIHSRKNTPDEIFNFSNIFRKKYSNVPLICVPTSYNSVYEDELIENGFNVVIYANQLLRAAYPAMYKTAEKILFNQRALEADKELMSIKDILKLIPGTV
tara:strand:+ start:736 stop:2058 length:1323 start_codon:yes stop_codon:yes gene_type:complete